MVIAGNLGLAVNALSFYYSFRMTVTGDEGVISKEQVHKLCNYLENAIQEQIDLMDKNPQESSEAKKDK